MQVTKEISRTIVKYSPFNCLNKTYTGIITFKFNGYVRLLE
jgi:hypothetical protein